MSPCIQNVQYGLILLGLLLLFPTAQLLCLHLGEQGVHSGRSTKLRQRSISVCCPDWNPPPPLSSASVGSRQYRADPLVWAPHGQRRARDGSGALRLWKPRSVDTVEAGELCVDVDGRGYGRSTSPFSPVTVCSASGEQACQGEGRWQGTGSTQQRARG